MNTNVPAPDGVYRYEALDSRGHKVGTVDGSTFQRVYSRRLCLSGNG